MRTLLWLAVAAVVVYAGLKLGLPYVKYQMLRMHAQEMTRLSHVLEDEEMVKKLLADAEYWGLPITERDIIVSRTGDEVAVNISYTVRVSLIGGYWMDQHYEIGEGGAVKTVDSSFFEKLKHIDFLLGRERKRKEPGESGIPGLGAPVRAVDDQETR